MRTTLDLPDTLVNEALMLTKIPTKTELIKFTLDVDLNKLRKR